MTHPWPEVPLAEVASVERRVVDPRAIEDGTEYLGLEHLGRSGRILGREIVGPGDLGSSKHTFTEDDVLFGKLRPNLGKVVAPSFAGVSSTDILPIRPGPALDRRYLLRFLLRPEQVAKASAGASGANLPRLSPKVLMDFPVPLPPIEEQRRIAAILDAADEVRAKRQESLEMTDSLTEAIFLDMFGDPLDGSSMWPVGILSDVVLRFEAGKSIETKGVDPSGSQYQVLKVSCLTSGRYRASESKPVDRAYMPPPGHLVRDGDLLFSRANTEALVGAVARVVDPPAGELLSDKIWRFVWREPMLVRPTFVEAFFQRPRVRSTISSLATGTSGSMKNISQAKVMSLPIGLPPLQFQIEFEDRLTKASEVRREVERSQDNADELFASLQQRAFRGEL